MSNYLLSHDFRFAIGMFVVFWTFASYYFCIDDILADNYCSWLQKNKSSPDYQKFFKVLFVAKSRRWYLFMGIVVHNAGLYWLEEGGTYLTFALSLFETIAYFTSTRTNVEAKHRTYNSHLAYAMYGFRKQ